MIVKLCVLYVVVMIFAIGETIYFGCNLIPASIPELLCDMLVVVGIIACIRMAIRLNNINRCPECKANMICDGIGDDWGCPECGYNKKYEMLTKK